MSQSDMTMGTHPAVLERSSPFAIPTKKLAIWLFIVADGATFAACLVAYGFLAQRFAQLAHAVQVLPHRGERDGDDVHPYHQQLDHVARCAGRQDGRQGRGAFAGS